MKLTSASRAAATISRASASVVRSPNIIVPRQMIDTSSPLVPSRRNCIVSPVCRFARRGRSAVGDAAARRARTTAIDMNVLFEDDGQLKAGTLLADNDMSLQVEAVSGKRHKVKAAHVLLRFASPSAAETIARAHELVRGIDIGFLWEASGDDEFGFIDLAREYYGATPAAPEAASIALSLAAAPMYFYRKGRGRYRRAPPEALTAALASVARKEREARDIAAWADELAARRLPDALA